MSLLIDKAGFAARIHDSLLAQATLAGGEPDALRLLQLLAGVMVETLMLFDEPDEGLAATAVRLCADMGAIPQDGPIAPAFMPPAHILDTVTEQGRGLARALFEDWLDCAWEFNDVMIFTVHHILSHLEQAGCHRSASLRLFLDYMQRALALEIAAQELCDIVIDEKIGIEGWSLAESVSGLSAVAGRCLGLMPEARQAWFAVETLDPVAFVMTQEATRLGIPAGTDWKFGLVANDGLTPSAPFDLIFSLWPRCRDFLSVIGITSPLDQAVALAKAAGRMLAVAAGGDTPEVEPWIAKPLAMAALTETCQTFSRDEAMAL